MTKEQQETCEKFVETLDEKWIQRVLAAAQENNLSYEAGILLGIGQGVRITFNKQTPEMLMLNPLVKGLVEATQVFDDLLDYVLSSYATQDEPKEIAEAKFQLEKALAPFSEVVE